MQFSYTQPFATIGQIANCDPDAIATLRAPLLAQISTITVVDNDAGAYSVSVSGVEGSFSASLTVVAQSIAQIANELADAINAQELAQNIVTATSDGVDTITLAFLHSGFSYDVSVASASADLTLALTQAAGGDSFPLGIGVVDSGGELGRLPTTGDVALDILGVTVRTPNNLVPFGFNVSPAPAGTLAGYEMSVMRMGSCWVVAESAVSANDPLYCRVVATGSEQAGALRNDSDGGDAVQLRGRWRTSASAGGLARIEISQP